MSQSPNFDCMGIGVMDFGLPIVSRARWSHLISTFDSDVTFRLSKVAPSCHQKEPTQMLNKAVTIGEAEK